MAKSVASVKPDQNSELLAAAAHELKTPLAIMSNIASATRGGLFGEVNPAVNQQLQRIEFTCARLTGVVDGLLSLEKLRSGVADLKGEPVSLAAIVSETMQELQSLAEEKRQEISLHAKSGVPPVHADHTFIYQIIFNLLHNALKYSPERAQIIITVSKEGDYVVVALADMAPPLAAADKRHIFKKFSPLSSRAGLPGSNGLGLYLCQNLATLMQGSLTHRANRGGNRFFLRLPTVQQLSLFGEPL